MPDSRVIEQVVGILTVKEVPFTSSESGDSFQVASGSAAVHIFFDDWRNDTLIVLRAAVLQNVDSSGKRRQTILEEINRFNSESLLGALVLYDDQKIIALEYSLRGAHLEADELVGAVEDLVFRADDLDDKLIKTLGTGESWADFQAGTGAAEDAGPVVST